MDAISEPSAERTRLIAKELQLAVSARHRTLHFHGESMRPFLVEGDEVVVEPVDWEQIRIGDVITYRQLDRFPTRRVVRKSADRLDLWCENWPQRFFSARRDEVLGRVVARRRGGLWLGVLNLEWQAARLKALARYSRIALLPAAFWRTRSFAGRLLRAVGLRRKRPG